MFSLCRSTPPAALILAAVLASPAAFATNAPADACSLLPAAAVSKSVGRTFDAPARTVAPRPFRNTVQGTDCLYQANGGRVSVMFRVYFDPSPSESAELFKRLQGFFGAGTAAPGLGDEAYFDGKHGLHERKGNVRFYLELNGTDTSAPAKEKVLANMAKEIGGRL